MSNASGIRAGSAYIELTASDAALVRGLEKARKRLRAFSVSIATVGRKLMLAATVSAAPFIMSSKAFASFEQQIAEVSAVTQASAQEMRRLTEQARLLGRTTSYMAVEAAKGMTELGRAGFKPAEIEATIPHILNLARATRIELGEAATVTADTMRSMGLAASDAQRIVDVLGATANSSTTDIKLIAEALKYAAPAAQKAGASIEETAAAIGVMANNGVKGSMAGTALARTYVMLARADSQKVLRSMGIQAVDAAGNLRPVAQIMSELGEATKKMGSAQRISIFNAVVDRRGSLAAMSLANKSQYKAMRKELEGITGLTSRMAKQMDNTLAGSFRRLRATIEGAAIEIGKALTPTLRSWMDTMRDSVNRIAEFIRYNGQAVVWLMKLTIAAAAAGAALIALSIAGKIVAGSLAVLSFASAGVIISLKAFLNVALLIARPLNLLNVYALRAMRALTMLTVAVLRFVAVSALAIGGLLLKGIIALGPILALMALKFIVITGVVAAVTGTTWVLWRGVKALGSAFVDLWHYAGVALGAIGSAFSSVASAASAFWSNILNSGRAVWSGLVAGFKRVAEVFKVVWGGVAQALAANDLEGAMRIVWAGIKVLWAEGIAELTEWWEALKTVISDLWDTKAMNVFIALWSTLKAGVMGVFAEMIRLWSWVKSLNPATMKKEMHIRDDIALQEVMAKQARERRAVAVSRGDRPGAAQATRDEEIANESIKNLKAKLDALLMDPKLAAKLRDLDKGIIAETNKAESAAANYGTRTPAQAAAEAARKAAGAANVAKSQATASAARQELADAISAAGVMDDLAEIFDRIPARTETIMRDLADFFSFEGPAGGSKAQKEMGASAAWAMSGPRSSQGTFSATAARFMGFGDVQERMATSLEAIEENTKDTVDGLAGLGVSYG